MGTFTTWTVKHAEMYRKAYPKLTFENKQKIYDIILSQYYQIPMPALYLKICLASIPRKDLQIVEVGGYDGAQALQILESNPRFTWRNFEISQVALQFTKKELAKYKYEAVLLKESFIDKPLEGNYDVFYSCRLLEHLTWNQVERLIRKIRDIPHHIHIVDWLWADDTHVIEGNKEKELVELYQELNFKILDLFTHPQRTQIYVEAAP